MKRKWNIRGCALSLVAVLLLPLAPIRAAAAWANPFQDVKPGAWYYNAVEYVNT